MENKINVSGIQFVEVWSPSVKIGWVEVDFSTPHEPFSHSGITGRFVLRQLWISNFGKQEWRPLEIITNTAELIK